MQISERIPRLEEDINKLKEQAEKIRALAGSEYMMTTVQTDSHKNGFSNSGNPQALDRMLMP
jgi:hypothetical protein